jgi:glyoxylase I family protein
MSQPTTSPISGLHHFAVAHSGIQSKEEPFVYSTIVFRDLDKMQLEFVAIDV